MKVFSKYLLKKYVCEEEKRTMNTKEDVFEYFY